MKKLITMIVCTVFLTANVTQVVLAQEVTENLQGIDEVVNQYIEEGAFPGAAVVVGDSKEILFEEYYGFHQLYDMGEELEETSPITKETIFDLASLTKVIATTTSIMKLYYDGDIDLDAPVADYLPEFSNNGKEDVTISDLLTHTSGLTPWDATFFYVEDREGMREYLSDLPLEYETGTDRIYSDFSFITLGLVVEEITGMPLDEYVETNIYEPLSMNHTVYTPLDEEVDFEIAVTSWGNPYEYKMVDDDEFGYLVDEDAEDFDGWRDYTLVGEVNDGNTFYSLEGVSGHAGLFSTGQDLAKLLQLYLNGGTLDGVTLFDEATIELFTTEQSEFGHGFGWEINRGGVDEGYMGQAATENFFGHTGFTGTAVVVDKENDLFVIMLTNKQNMGQDEDGYYSNSFRFHRDVMDVVYGAENEE